MMALEGGGAVMGGAGDEVGAEVGVVATGGETDVAS